MSFDMKLMFVHHVATLVLFMTGGKLSIRSELVIWIVLVSALLSLSIRHRRQVGWRWPGASIANYFQAAGALALGAIFMGAGHQLFPPTDPNALPWYLGALGLIMFGVACTLRITTSDEADFVSSGSAPGEFAVPAEMAPAQRGWRKWVRHAYAVLFLALWLEGMAFIYVWSAKYRDGSPSPTSTKTEPLYNHGSVVYIAPSDKALINALEAGSFLGGSAVLIIGVILQFGLHVPIFRRCD